MSLKEFICPICGKKMARDLAEIVRHTEHEIMVEIKRAHPEWVSKEGLCHKCHVFYKEKVKPHH